MNGRVPVLKPFIEEMIQSDSFKSRGLFNLSNVKRAYNDFCGGNGENSFFIWQWINTELWFRTFIDKKVKTEDEEDDYCLNTGRKVS